MTKARVLYLDGLRGVLAIIVFVHHFLYTFYPEAIFGGNYQEFSQSGPFTLNKLLALTPLNIFFNPGMAIHFFFFLSGYVQSQHYFENNKTWVVQMAFLKRYFRLALPTLAVVVVVYLCHRLGLFTKDLIPVNALNEGWIKSMLPNNLHFMEVAKHGLFDSFHITSKYYHILWTMPTEIYNSWMVLILLLVTHRFRFKAWVFLLWLLAQLILLQSYYSMAFTIGLLLCYWEHNSETFSKIISNKAVRYLSLIIGIYFASYPFTGYQRATANSVYAPISFFDEYPHIISYLVGDFFLFCFLLRSNFSRSVLSKKVFLFFGEISFMFYLVHFIVVFSFTGWIYARLGGQQSGGTGLIVAGAASFVIVTLFSYVLHKIVDEPTVKLCNYCMSKIKMREEAEPV